ARDRGPHDLRGRRRADPGGVVVDQVPLEPLDLLVGEDDLGELADPRVGPVHDLAGRQLLLEHRPADPYALERRRVDLDLLARAGDAHERLDRQRRAVQDDGHGTPPVARLTAVSILPTGSGRAGAERPSNRGNFGARTPASRPGGDPWPAGTPR